MEWDERRDGIGHGPPSPSVPPSLPRCDIDLRLHTMGSSTPTSPGRSPSHWPHGRIKRCVWVIRDLHAGRYAMALSIHARYLVLMACSCMRANGAHRAAWIMIAAHCREDASEAKETTREGSVKAVQHDYESVGGMVCPGNGNPQPCGPSLLASTYNGWPPPPKLCRFSSFLSSASLQSSNQFFVFVSFLPSPLFFLFSIIELRSIDLVR